VAKHLLARVDTPLKRHPAKADIPSVRQGIPSMNFRYALSGNSPRICRRTY